MRTKLLFLTIVLIGTSLGQPPQMEDRRNPQNMDAIRIWKLTEVLELTEDQVVTFLPLVQIHERKLKEIQGEIRTLAKDAYALREKGEVNQKQVDKFLKQYAEKQQDVFKIKNDFITGLPDHLTPEQQLIYIGFEARFRSDLREYMKNERRGEKNLRRTQKKDKN
ncbi:MAG: hypothetical protein HQ506_06770 [Candidatus Marinimicrobia bacterium]|nr:hypothetical protein [Candidatus Neomarinimicrobiota bacterium]